MAIPFQAVVQPDTIVFTTTEGRTHAVAQSHPNFQRIREQIKAIREARAGGMDIDALVHALVRLTDISQTLAEDSSGRVVVRDGVVYYDGEEIHGAITDHIVWGLREGEDVKPHIAFLQNLMENPSKRSVDQLYQFIVKHGMALTEDGHILAYKRVRGDFTDCHSGKFDNSPGRVVEMPRNKVNDNPNETCSTGLHFCAQSYLPNFGNDDGNRIVIVKVNPRDVVSIPTDYNHAKARCCRYEVLGEYAGTDKDDLLTAKPIWREDTIRDGTAWRGSEHSSEEEEEPHYEEDEEEHEGYVDEEVDLDDTREDLDAAGTANLSLERVSLTKHKGEVIVTFMGFDPDSWNDEGEVEVSVPDTAVDTKAMLMQVGVVARGVSGGEDVVLIEFPQDSDEDRLWVPETSLTDITETTDTLVLGEDGLPGSEDSAEPVMEDYVSGTVSGVGSAVERLPVPEPVLSMDEGLEDPNIIAKAVDVPEMAVSPVPQPEQAEQPKTPPAMTGVMRMTFDPKTGAIKPV